MTKLTVGIPVYEMRGKGIEYLSFLLEKLNHQTVFPDEILISDNSNDKKIKKFIIKYDSKINIRYIKNYGANDPCTNLNNIIENSKGEYIKFIFQDDFPFSNKLIDKTIKAIQENLDKNWFVCGSNNSNDTENFFNYIKPYFNNRIYLGKNTLGSPSVLTIKNSTESILFDTRFIWLLDCIYYYMLNKKFGPPVLIDQTLVTCRIHTNQLTDVLDHNNKLKEVFLANKLFNKSCLKYYLFIEIFFTHFMRKVKLILKRFLNSPNFNKFYF
jgi:hypothetical protein